MLAIALVLDVEKGYVVDTGGPTNYGVTLTSLIAWGDPDGDGWEEGDFNRDGRIDVEDVKNMSKEDATAFYNYWWNMLDFEDIAWQPVANKVFDMTVNMGPHQAGKLVQRAINCTGRSNVKVDGIIGPITRRELNRFQPRQILPALREQMENFYRYLIQRNPAKYGNYEGGWLNRAVL